MSWELENEVVRRLAGHLPDLDRAHEDRVAVYATAIAHEMGIAGRALRSLRYAATLRGVDPLRLDEDRFLSGAARIVRAYQSGAENTEAGILRVADEADRILNGHSGGDLSLLDDRARDGGLDPEAVAALRRVQRLIQPLATG